MKIQRLKQELQTRTGRQALFRTILEELFYKRGAIPQIYGKIKTGKTDFACMLANQAVYLERFQRVATNIVGTPNSWTFIKDTYELWEWMKQGQEIKTPGIFLFDEADGAVSPMRHGSNLNKMVADILWQAGKCYVQTIPITHRSKDVDTRIRWLKHTLIVKRSKRTVLWESELKSLIQLRQALIQLNRWPLQVPSTKVSFDPDAIAHLKYKPHPDFKDNGEEKEAAREKYKLKRIHNLRREGKTWREISNELSKDEYADVSWTSAEASRKWHQNKCGCNA